MQTHTNFYIITGGPGAGKTTLLLELEKRGYKCIPEVARRIIQEQMASGGDALPWKNMERYTIAMQEGSIAVYIAANKSEITFFDRGIPDTITHCNLINKPVPDTLKQAAENFRYNKIVFMLPPWKEIYETDTERKQTWEEAAITYIKLNETYEEYGYKLIEIPPLPVAERADFLLSHIS